jgi:nucleotide-binding universal stress UspA family protein
MRLAFPPRSIICPIDFSPASRTALRHARALAARFGATETVLYVEDPFLVQAARAANLDTSSTEKEVRKFIAASSTRRRAPEPNVMVVAGKPADEILKAAAAVHADLIVMATHGLSGPKRLMFGSTTAAVLQKTTLPVLATPEKARWQAMMGGSTRLAAGIELSDQTEHDVQAVAKVAAAFGAKLELIHVVAAARAPKWLPLPSQHVAAPMAEAKSRLAAAAGQVRDVAIAVRVLAGDPAEQIVKTASSVRASTILLRLRRGHGLLGQTQGSFTYRVLGATKVPVLALPPQP